MYLFLNFSVEKVFDLFFLVFAKKSKKYIIL